MSQLEVVEKKGESLNLSSPEKQTAPKIQIPGPSNHSTKRKFPLWVVIVAVLALWIAYSQWNRVGRTLEVNFATAKVKEVTGSFTAEAFVRGKSYDVVAETSGRIVKLMAEEGRPVQKNQVIAELESTEATQNVAKAEAVRNAAANSVNQARQELQLTQRESNAAIESARMRVKQAEAALKRAKAGAQPEEISQAQHRVDSAQSGHDEAQKAFDRATILYREGAISKATLDSAEARFRSLSAELEGAKDALRLVERGPRAEDIAISEANLNSTKADLNTAIESSGQVAIRRSSVRSAESVLSQAQADLAKSLLYKGKQVILSPASGIISKKATEPGMFTTPGQVIAQVSTREDIRIEAEVDTEDISKVSVGMPVKITSAAYPSQVFNGKVQSIMPSGELKPGSAIRTRIVRVRISLEGDWKAFRPEMELDIEGQAVLKRALVVPSDALTFTGDKATVWVVRDGVVSSQTVKVGYTGASESEIVDGLKEGDTVVTSGKEELTEGRKVKPRQPNGP